MAYKWFNDNQLSLNITKTKALNLWTHGQNTQFLVNDEEIENISENSSHNYLGIEFDSRLKFSKHVKKQINKSRNGLRMLHACKETLDRTTLKTLYYIIIHPTLTYV